MPRVLVVYQHLPHYRRDVFRELESTEGWEFHFAAGASSRDPGIATMAATDLRHVHVLDNVWLGPFLWQRGLFRLLRQPWDHVILLGDVAYLSTWAAAAELRARKKRVAFWTIGWHRPESGLRRRIRLAFYSLADQLLLYGSDAQRLGAAAGYPADRMSVVGNSSSAPPTNLEEDDARLAEIDRALSEVAQPAVGAVIRLTSRKRLDLLIDAVALLEREGGPRLAVVLAGDGPEATPLREQARALGVDLHLLGPIYGERALERFYGTCLTTVVPSLAGLTTLQSLKYGRPVITHDDPMEQVPEYEAIRPGSTGDLYVKGDLEDLAKVIAFWVNQMQVAPAEVAAACREAVQDGWTPAASAFRIVEALAGERAAEPMPVPFANRKGCQ